MANKHKPAIGKTVTYTPYDDDAQVAGPQPGIITEIHHDGSVNLTIQQGALPPGSIEIPGAPVTRQFVPQGENGSYNAWVPAPDQEAAIAKAKKK